MRVKLFCNTIAKQNPSALLPFLAPAIHNPANLRYTSLTLKPAYRSISSTQCLSSPPASAPARKQTQPEETQHTAPKKDSNQVSPTKANLKTNSKSTSQQEEETTAPAQSYMEETIPLTSTTTPRFGAPQSPRRPNIRSTKQSQIAELLASTTRAPNQRSSAQLLRDRVPMMTPTARRQEDLVRSLGSARGSGLGSSSSALDIEHTLFGNEHMRLEPPPPVRMDAYMGRAQTVDPDRLPLGRALGYMKQKLMVEQVKATLRAQRFHERPGLRRKRLKSERWRKRFMEGFRHMVVKVKKMKAQGW